MDVWGIAIIISIVAAVLVVGFYFLNKWAGQRAATQQEMVAQHKQSAAIYVIDKKKDKITNANFPKAVAEQIPRMSKIMKVPLVKAKIGPQIMTLVCDDNVFDALPVKKTVTVDIAGAYIVGMKGMKTKMEMAQIRKERRRETGETAPKWHENLLARFKK